MPPHDDDDRDLYEAAERARRMLDRARERREQPQAAGLVGVDALLNGFEASLDCLERLKRRQDRQDARIERLETFHDPRRALSNGSGGYVTREMRAIWFGVRSTLVVLGGLIVAIIAIRALLTADSELLQALFKAVS